MKREGNTMAVKKRKHEVLDDSNMSSLENDLPSVGREKMESSPNEKSTPVNGEATHSKKRIRLGQKDRRKTLNTLDVGLGPSVDQRAPTKQEHLVDLIRKRRLERGVTVSEPMEVQVDDENYITMSDKPNCVGDKEGEKESASKEPAPFDAKLFRKVLRSIESDRIEAFKLFVKQLGQPVIVGVEPKVDVAAEYMAAGGSALELLQVLDPTKRDNFSHANPVFKALQVLIMRGLTDSPAFIPSCEEACRHLLNAYLPTIQRMISEHGGPQERKTVLKLLTGVISMSSAFAKDVLATVAFPGPILKLVTQVAKAGEKRNSVRTCFIHYLMAFLVDKNISLIAPLLNKRGLVTSILDDLLYDDAATAHLVLTTIRTSIAENRLVNKTQKLKVFNTNVLKVLIKLYNWRGPKMTSTLKRKGSVWSELKTADPEDKRLVVEALHQLLLVLCTNHKLGIVFFNESSMKSGMRANELMWSILIMLECPWENEHIRDLVVKILVACPDLVKAKLRTVALFLEPRVSISWLQTVGFVKQLVEAMNPDQCLKPYYKDLTFSQLENIVRTMCAPTTILEALDKEVLLHENIIVRHAAFDLLNSMAKQMNKFFDVLDEWEAFKEEGDRRRFRLKITKQFPSTSVLLEAWGKVGTPSTPTNLLEHTPPVANHASLILDLMLMYHRLNPGRFKTEVAAANLSMKKLVANMNGIGVAGTEGMDQIQIKAVELVMSMDAFHEDKETLSESLDLLFQLLRTDDSPATSSAYTVLTSILTKTHLFDRSPDEIDIWLHCYRSIRTAKRAIVAKLLVKALVSVLTEPEKYEKMVNEAMEKAGGETDSTSQPRQISALLSSVLVQISCDNINSKELKKFLNLVVVHLFHSQQSPTIISYLVDKKYLDLNIHKYIQSWLNLESEPSAIPLGKTFDCESLEYKISNAILRLEDDSMADILGLGETSDVRSETNVDDEPMIHDAAVCSVIKRPIEDPSHQTLLFNLTLFIFTRLASRKETTEASISKCSATFKALLTLTKQSNKYFRSFFEHPVVLENLTFLHSKKDGKDLSTTLIYELIRWAMTNYPSEELVNVLQPYKDKYVAFVIDNMKKSKDIDKCHQDREGLLDAVEIFNLEFKDVLILIKELSLTSPKILMVSTTGKPMCLSVWGSLLAFLLRRVTTMRATDRTKSDALPQNVVSAISQHLVRLFSHETPDLVMLEEGFVMYLKQFSHNIADVSKKLFLSIIGNKAEHLSKSRVELGVLLLTHRIKTLGSEFEAELLKSNEVVEKSQLVFPFLSVLIDSKFVITDNVLQTIYKRYELDLVKSIRKPKKVVPWIANNTTVIVRLIESCMSVETCKELCAIIQTNVGKYTCAEYHIHLIESVFRKANRSNEEGVEPIVTLTKVLLELLADTASKDKSNVDLLCNLIRKNVGKEREVSMWEPIKVAPVWLQFTKQALKLGLQSIQKEYDSGLLLHTLSDLCQVMYENGGNDEEISTLFEMTMSHSEFLTVMLGSTPLKPALVQLLTTFVGKNTTVMSSSHIPVLLSSYNASLSRTDQLLLKLMRTYEESDVSLSDCRPYLWGEAAVNYFCVKTNEPLSLWRQPTMGMVVDLLKYDVIKETVKEFPLDRKLELDEYEDKPLLYDPAFLLPLFSHLLVPEASVQCHKFNHTGCLALTLASLGSSCMSMRAAAYHVLARYYYHIDSTRDTPDKKWSLHFMDIIKNGVVNLGGEAGPQLPCIVSTFLARTSRIISTPLDPMFAPLNKFILAKPAMDLKVIPELHLLFHSMEMDSKTYRHWILEVIRDGLHLASDWRLCLTSMLYKLLLVFYSSVIGSQDRKSKVLILEIVNSAVKLPGVARLLVSSYGLFPWLHQAVRNFDSSDNDLINVMIQITTSLMTSTKYRSKNKDEQSQREDTRSQNINRNSFHLNLSLLLLSLLPKLPASITVGELKKYLTIFEVVSETQNIFTVEHLKSLVLFSKDVLGNVDDCEDLLEFGCKYASKSSKRNVLNDDFEDAKSCLRQILMKSSVILSRDVRNRKETMKIQA